MNLFVNKGAEVVLKQEKRKGRRKEGSKERRKDGKKKERMKE